jgi:dinuclear metal center YbgI/SA1388 family protein
VDASLATYRRAVEAGCQMLVVHHGLIWNGLARVTGTVHRHLEYLLGHRLNLYASHLPLDLHPRVGNNARLAAILGLKGLVSAFEYHGFNIGCRGRLRNPLAVREIADRLAAAIGGRPLVLPFGKKKNRTVGLVSGGGAEGLGQAISMGLDCYVTGEPAHYNHHQAVEGGLNVIYAGHYETETVGVRALGRVLERRFRVKTAFLHVPTRV